MGALLLDWMKVNFRECVSFVLGMIVCGALVIIASYLVQ